nr:immunoglobulin heavy chain junction region [Macaca mulatta]MOX38195.1 immunoglobulin heavy chain junction region [Macaca mulatta]MOX38413.1 immunoglobulin heavy chain junction region [Macaca mulatta]MOX38590.1 immunoglobulin heavy chain junction region [Macaca mulatta]MOX38797.1 immunoglobulin heavy chain junction region [Macaca mulatta]
CARSPMLNTITPYFDLW